MENKKEFISLHTEEELIKKWIEHFNTDKIEIPMNDVFQKIQERLEHARAEHPESEWQGKGIPYAFRALLDEVREMKEEYDNERIDALHDELLDVVVVAIRILNKEYE